MTDQYDSPDFHQELLTKLFATTDVVWVDNLNVDVDAGTATADLTTVPSFDKLLKTVSGGDAYIITSLELREFQGDKMPYWHVTIHICK